jgi:hypothetical protein
MHGVSAFDLEQLLSWLIPSPADCLKSAEEIRLSDPNATAEEHARRAVKNARKWAVSVGALTGIAASPLTMLPAAAADAAAMLKLEGKLAGTIAALLDPDSLANEEFFRREIIRAVFPGAISQALRKVGVRAGEEATKSVVRKIVGHEAGKEIGERAAKFLGIRLSEKAVATKTVPLVGAGIGAAWNWLEIQAVGNRAVDYHLGIPSQTSRARKKVASIVRDVRNKLPRRGAN